MFIERLRSFFGFKKGMSSKTEKKVGTIRYFNRKKGFGFIESKQTEVDVFVHIQDTQGRISLGDKVEFEVEQEPKGLRARKVELLSA